MNVPEPFAGVPAWQTAEWDRHAARAVQHWCIACETYLVPRDGAVCPVCSSTATFEGTA